jgi:hypothetical protein
MNVLQPISTLPADATHDSVQLYRDARGHYCCTRNTPPAFGVEECIPCRDFQMTVVDAKYWMPRERPIPVFPTFK